MRPVVRLVLVPTAMIAFAAVGTSSASAVPNDGCPIAQKQSGPDCEFEQSEPQGPPAAPAPPASPPQGSGPAQQPQGAEEFNINEMPYAAVATFAETYSATHGLNTPPDPGLPPGYITVTTVPGWVIAVTDPFVSPVAEPDVSITSLPPPAPGEFIGLPNFAFYGYEVRGPEPAPVPVDFGVPPAPPAQPDPPTLGPNEVNPEVDPGPVTSTQPNADEATSDAAGGTASGVAAPGEASTGEASAGEGSTGQGSAGEGSTGESSGGGDGGGDGGGE